MYSLIAPFKIVHMQAKNMECLRILLVFGADVNKCNSEGRTPSDIARHHMQDVST